MKSSGLGDNFYVNQYDISGDVNSLGTVSTTIATLDVTGIDKYAMERIAGQINGQIDFTTLFNTAADKVHDALSGIPTTNIQASYFHKTTIGNPAASIVGKQINYDGTRGQDGDMKFNVSVQSNGYGLEWGNQLTAGVRSDTDETDGTAWDTGASKSFGAQAYLHVTEFTGDDVTITIEDSADNVTFSPVISFTEVTDVGFERIATGLTETLARYVRVSTTTSAGFDSVSFAVNLVKNTVASAQF